jgi:hypothetical protein
MATSEPSSPSSDEPSPRKRTRRLPRSAFPAVPLATPSGFISPKLEGRLDPGKGGKAVFARVRIDEQETLVVWGGEIITRTQLQLLPEKQRHRLCLQVEEGLFLMTSREGPADWVNHSCDPNSGMCGQIVLVAMREIAPGEEICFDYAMADSYPYDEFDCECGSTGCRNRITAEDWRRLDLQERYRGFFSPYLQKRILGSGGA